MATSHIVYSNFFSRNDIYKHVSIMQGKNLIIDALREMFTNDSVYPYRQDEYGFPLVKDHTDLPNEYAGTGEEADGTPIDDSNLSTKILITDVFREDVNFYPVITVKHSGGNYMPISFNQNMYTVHYRVEIVRDAYGNQHEVVTPSHYVFDGAWEQTFEVKIVAQDPADREELADIVSVGLQHVARERLINAGLFIKKVNLGGEQEEERNNGYLYTYSFTLNTFSEWSRAIPIRDTIERINLYFDLLNSGINPRGSYLEQSSMTNSLTDMVEVTDIIN